MEPCRILIVEDDPLISSHLEALVTTNLASEVIVGTSVAQALDLLQTGVDFALLDVDVLDGTTYGVASRLMEDRIPFGFVSASDRGQMPEALRDVPFVAKPYTDDDIVGLLRNAGKVTTSAA